MSPIAANVRSPGPARTRLAEWRAMWQRALAPGRRQYLVVAAIAAALGGVAYAIAAGGDYFADDFLNARIAHDMGFTRDYLMLNVFGHLAPAMRLVDWLTVRYLPFDYRLTLAISVTVYALTLVALFRLLRAVAGPSRWTPLLVLLYGVSPLWLVSVFWWAGINALAANLFVIVALDGYVRYRDRRRARHLVQCAVAFGIALLFYEKAALLPVYAALLDVLLLSRGGLRDMARGLLRAWPLWLVMLAVAGAFLGVYLHGHYLASGAHPGARTMLRFLGLAWGRGLVPDLVGGPLGFDWAFTGASLGRPAPPGWLIAVGQLVVAVVVVAGVRRRRTAWRAWLFLALAFAAGMAMIGWGRLAGGDLAIAQDTRYLFDSMFLVFVALAAVFLQPADAPAAAARPRRVRVPARAGVAAGLAAVAVVVLGAGVSTADAASHWTGSQGSHYMHSLRAALPARTGTSFYDRTVPIFLVIPQFYPYSRYSTVLWLIDRNLRFNAPDTGGDVVDDRGRLVPATLRHVATATATGDCAREAAPLDFSVDRPPGQGIWFLRFRASSATPTAVVVQMAIPGGFGLGATAPLAIEAGTHDYVTDLVPGAPLGVRIVAPPGASVCTGDAELVEPVPAAAD